MAIQRLHIWGDSLAKGVVFDEARKRYCITPDRCVVALEKALSIEIANHSRMGAICPEGLADFLEAPADPGTAVAIEYGGNDCDMPWKAVSEDPDAFYNGRVSREDFAHSLGAFVDAVRERAMHPILVTPPPLEAERYFRWVTKGLSAENVLHFLGDVQHIYRWQERYAVTVRNVALEKACILFDLRDAFLNHRWYPTLMCADGIHPNAEGHAVIVQAVLDARQTIAQALARETQP